MWLVLTWLLKLTEIKRGAGCSLHQSHVMCPGAAFDRSPRVGQGRRRRPVPLPFRRRRCQAGCASWRASPEQPSWAPCLAMARSRVPTCSRQPSTATYFPTFWGSTSTLYLHCFTHNSARACPKRYVWIVYDADFGKIIFQFESIFRFLIEI